ncbi:MAG TPA: NAD(P)-dependent oxidoreductase [Victivallales bacterium]|nr:NAD(P)-dependent oxidoreductase [Victivallales bacterium]
MKCNLKNKKVMITGGLGFIGSNLACECLELGAKVTIYDCLEPNSGGNMYNIHNIREDITLKLHDILNFDQISQCIADNDIIINCAASTSHPFSMSEPWANNDVNVKGVINILEAIRRFNPEARFVHIGTTTQLGKLKYTPADEFHPEFPMDIYSANKCSSEKYVLIYASAHNLKASVIRLSNVFGPKAAIHSPEFTFNNYFVGLALQNKSITVFGRGEQKRNVIYVDDAIRAIISIISSTKTYGETLLGVSDEHFSIAQIAKETVTHIGSGKVEFHNWPKTRKAIEVGDAIISNNKIKELTDWVPENNLVDGLLKTKAYYNNCKEQYLR